MNASNIGIRKHQKANYPNLGLQFVSFQQIESMNEKI